tara:strand:- start:3652 stop:4677 length:1026 start_codon:yes stop_codon:yes gene_type:complete
MKFILTLVASLLFTVTSAMAEYRLVVPSPKGTGTAIWADVVAAELEKYLGERVIVENIKGGKGNVGLETFNTKYKDDPKTILLAHGGNANAWLIENVNWSFKNWEPIMIQPYNITTTIKSDFDWQNEKLNLADCSGCVPETLGWTLLIGWDNINFVRKMSAGDAKQAWLRGDFNYIREPASRHIKNTLPMVEGGEALRLFNHGMFTPNNGFVQDPNWPDTPMVTDLYKDTFGKDPSGDVYEAYILSAVWRDGLQKGLFMHPGANTEAVVDAFERMMANEDSRKYLISKLGDYPMYFGEESNIIMDSLYGYVTKERLKLLVDFAKNKMEWSTAEYVDGKTID